ncbi:hypothetical protein EYC80_002093 [Monilinia laxa]|uniref:SET domain-containing protein n=1 Tax=Monilinia laxa TaxID=61186 RepID=A0A5N6K333_MONLA|nr:hypothetical protein EYC80_002093 [Monilinia laxa]
MVQTIYVKKDVPGKGIGLVAIQDIPKGTRIICEAATLTGPNNLPVEELRRCLVEQFHALSKHQQKEFLALSNIRQFKDASELYCGIYCTNALPLNEIDSSGGYLTQADRGGIFLEACRINHACDENAAANWNEDTKCLTVTASKDILKGEEIMIYYLARRNNYKARRACLLQDFNFECSCRLCSLPTKERKANDRQLDQTLLLIDFFHGRSGNNKALHPLRELHELDQMVCLYKEQGTGETVLGNIFIQAAHIAITHSDLARGTIFAQRARSAWTTIFGSDCMEIKRWGYIAKEPSKYKYYGYGKAWKTAVDEVPSDLAGQAFEDWLWKRNKLSRRGDIVDFRCSAIFPTLFGLPIPSNADYYDVNNDGLFRPKLHWCFLGEISDLARSGDSSLAVRDIGGTAITVAFHTEDGGKELLPALVRPGYTVAIINAKRYKLPAEDNDGHGRLGIHHDDELMLKVSCRTSPIL